MTSRGLMLVLGAAATMALAPLLNKMLAGEMPPMLIATVRVVLGVPFVLIVLRLAGKRLPRRLGDIGTAAVGGLTMIAIPFGAIAWGQQYIPSGMAGILYGLMPLLVVAGAWLFLADERPRLATLLGVLSGIAGVVLVVGPNVLSGLTPQGTGQLVTLLGPIAYAAGSVYVRRVGGIDALSLTAGMYIAAALMLCPVAAADIGHLWTIGLGTAVKLVILAVAGSVVPTLLTYMAIRTVGATRAALAMFAFPIFSVLYGAVVLHERLEYTALVGMLAILGGSLVIHRQSPRAAAI